MGASPNIVFVMADQLRADHLGCYGNDVAVTPAIDAMSAAGLRFDDCHVANTVCMPNRASIMTGRMPSLHGVRKNGIPLHHRETTFVEMLRSAGYRTSLIGKAHLQPWGMFGREPGLWPHAEDTVRFGDVGDYDTEVLHRWQDGEIDRVGVPYYGFEHVELCVYHGDKAEGDYATWLRKRDPAAHERRGPDHALPATGWTARDAWRTSVPEELSTSSWIAERSVEVIEAAASSDAPLFLNCSFPDPHHPVTPPGRYWSMVDPADVTLPATFKTEPPSPLFQWIHEVSGGGRHLPHSHMPFAPFEREAAEQLALTFGSIANIDAAVDRVLDAVEQLDNGRDTVVVFVSDHGDLGGDHGVFRKGPMQSAGLSHVPLIVRGPSIPAAVVPGSCGSIDIGPTILSLAGLDPRRGMTGVALPLDGSSPDQRWVFTETESTSLTFGRPAPFRLRGIRNHRWHLVHSNEAALCELYDLDNDPLEQHNRWADPALTETRSDLMSALADTSLDHTEQGITPWSPG